MASTKSSQQEGPVSSEEPEPDPETKFKGLIKDAILEVIAERETAPRKTHTDILSMLFGSRE